MTMRDPVDECLARLRERPAFPLDRDACERRWLELLLRERRSFHCRTRRAGLWGALAGAAAVACIGVVWSALTLGPVHVNGEAMTAPELVPTGISAAREPVRVEAETAPLPYARLARGQSGTRSVIRFDGFSEPDVESGSIIMASRSPQTITAR